MEFNILEHFKGLENSPKDPYNADEIGTSLFLTGNMGPRISAKIDGYAAKAGMSRRNFLKSSLGFSAAMLAANEVTGKEFFEVSAAEAADPDAKKEAIQLARASSDFIVDAHTHVCTRPGHYVEGVNTTTRGMWFVQLLDDLGKAFGLPNGTKDMNVENYGKMILKDSDTTVGVFNPFGFREDYGGQDMIPMEYQVLVRDNWPKNTVMLAGGLTPNQGLTETIDRLQMYVGKYKIAGLKLYTFDSTKKKGWWFDDEKLAYPIWEQCRKLGVKNIGCHKGIPFGQFYARYAHCEDLDADRGRLPRPELHRLSLGVAVPRGARGDEGLQAAAQEPVLRDWLDLRRDGDRAVRSSARTWWARCSATSARTTSCGGRTRCCGATRSGRSRRSASSRSRTSWWKGTVIRRSRRRSAARCSERTPRASGTSTSRSRCRPRRRSSRPHSPSAAAGRPATEGSESRRECPSTNMPATRAA